MAGIGGRVHQFGTWLGKGSSPAGRKTNLVSGSLGHPGDIGIQPIAKAGQFHEYPICRIDMPARWKAVRQLDHAAAEETVIYVDQMAATFRCSVQRQDCSLERWD